MKIEAENPGKLEFFGSDQAVLFSEEVRQSLNGVLEKSFTDDFVTTSVDGRVCSDQLWSRDAGALLRELAQWGYLGYACFLADILLTLVDRSKEGYFTFPMLFTKGRKGSGSELDGTGAAVIGLVLLLRRLVEGDPVRKRIYNFITGESSPVRYVLKKLDEAPLIAGSGEFGGGMGIPGEYYNVVQNHLIYLMLRSVEDMMGGNACAAAADKLSRNIVKYFIDEDGTWIWCVDPGTLKADPGILNRDENIGFGGINGVAAMYADVLGFELPQEGWKGTGASIRTFDRLLAAEPRNSQYLKFGMWTQFDVLIDGLLTSPAYGQGYAIQAALIFDRLDMAGRMAGYLADATYEPPKGYKLDRDSRYHFYERMLSPDFAGIHGFDQGCGALNLVNVAEPLKVARMIAGIDDTSAGRVRIIPRIPPSWNGYKATDWPILAGGKLSRADIQFEKIAGGFKFTLKMHSEDKLPLLEVRMPSPHGGYSWFTFREVSDAEIIL